MFRDSAKNACSYLWKRGGMLYSGKLGMIEKLSIVP